MLKTFAAVTLAFLVPAAVLAQAPATQPTTQPAAAEESRVLVVPFAPVEATDPDWIGRAVQQSLLADLSRAGGTASVQPVGDGTRIGSVAEAIEAGKKAGVRYVIFGSYQRIEPNLRITGQIVDVSSGRVVAGLKSTGSERNLFEMQDTLAFQAKWGLGTERLAEKSAAKATEAPGEMPAIQPQGPVVLAGERYADSGLSRAVADGRSLIERQDAAGQSYRDNYYDDTPLYPAGYYGGGYYGLGYPYYRDPYAWWWYGRRVIIINSDHHHHKHHRDRDKHHGGGSFNIGPVPTVGSRDYSIGVGNTMGSYRMTMQGAERNYVGSTPGPTNASRSGGGSVRVAAPPGRITPTPPPAPVRSPKAPVKPAK